MMMVVALANINMPLFCAEHHAKCFPYIQADSPLLISCCIYNPIIFVGSTEPTE